MEIAGTQFTVQWVGEQLCNGKEISLGKDVSIEKAEVKDQTLSHGLLSKIIKITFEWIGDDKHQLPTSVILKVPGMSGVNATMRKLPWTEEQILEQKALYAQMGFDPTKIFLTNVHSNEINFYHSFAKFSDKLSLPKIYYDRTIKEDEEGILVMEDLSEGTGVASLPDGLSLPQVKAIVDELAMLHVLSLTSDEWKQSILDYTLETAEKYLPKMKKIAFMLERLCPNLFPDMAEVAHLFEKEKFVQSATSFEQLELPGVVAHGDLWSSNIIWKKESSGALTAEMAAIIDWQMAHPGSCMEDIARLLVSSVSGSFRRENIDNILAFYHQKLHQYAKQEKVNVELFTMEKIRGAYDLVLPYATSQYLLAAPMFTQMTDLVGQGPDAQLKIQEIYQRARLVIDDILGNN